VPGFFFCVARDLAAWDSFLAFDFLSGAVLPHARYFRTETLPASRDIDVRDRF
jgi:hypothetical protein